jgi:hypothetical protein
MKSTPTEKAFEAMYYAVSGAIAIYIFVYLVSEVAESLMRGGLSL